jgi:hypothetical protein
MKKSTLALIAAVALIVSIVAFVSGQGGATANQERDKEVDRLVNTAKSDPNPEVRKKALVDVSKRICEQNKEFISPPNEKVDAETQKEKYDVLAIAKQREYDPIPRLIDIIKTHPKTVIRRHALYYLGHSGDARALEFFEELIQKERKSRTP